MTANRAYGLALVALWIGVCAGALAGEAKDFPCWRGADGSGTASAGLKLVDDINEARLVWRGDEIPGVYGAFPQTGQSGPVVANGRVFLVYHMPGGEEYNEELAQQIVNSRHWKNYVGKPIPDRYSFPGAYMHSSAWLGVNDLKAREAFARMCSAINADDTIHAFDAATGKTVWKAVFPGGLNYMNQEAFHSGKLGPHIMPCVYQGRVYAIGNIGKVFCVDEKTGAKVWDSNIGEHYTTWAANREQALKTLKMLGPESKWGLATGPIGADGVIAVFDERDHLLGFDAATGKKLWRTPVQGGRFYAAPVRWLHGGPSTGSGQGKEYFISGGGCIEPKTGKKLWQVPMKETYEPGTSAVGDDYMVWGVTCYKISPESFQELWELGGDETPQFKALRNATPVYMNKHFVFRIHGMGPVKRPPPPGPRMLMIEAETGKIAATAFGNPRTLPVLDCENSATIGGDGRIFQETHRDADSKMAMAIAEGPERFHADYASYMLVPGYGMSSTPCYANGFLYLRMMNHIACYDMRVAEGGAAAALKDERMKKAREVALGLKDPNEAKRRKTVDDLAAMGKVGQEILLAEFNTALDAGNAQLTLEILPTLYRTTESGFAAALDRALGVLRGPKSPLRDAVLMGAARLEVGKRDVLKPAMLDILKGGDPAEWQMAMVFLARLDAAACREGCGILARTATETADAKAKKAALDAVWSVARDTKLRSRVAESLPAIKPVLLDAARGVDRSLWEVAAATVLALDDNVLKEIAGIYNLHLKDKRKEAKYDAAIALGQLLGERTVAEPVRKELGGPAVAVLEEMRDNGVREDEARRLLDLLRPPEPPEPAVQDL